ncbi:MAG: TonB-dependent receptor [Gammaproteobacteria bacterium]
MSKLHAEYLLSIMTALWLAAPASLAQTAQSEAAADEEIVVLGARLEETIPLDLQQFGNRVEIITSDDLQLGGFNDLSQSLQMKVPGLYLAPKNGAFDYMDCSLQGSRCQDILWLIDGVRINNRLYNSTSPLDTVPAHMVERIEVLYGGQGIFYGTQAVAGVINVVTKSFSEQSGGNVALSVDGNDGSHLSADFSTSTGDHQFVFYASNDEADGFQPFLTDDYQPSGTDLDRGYDVLTAGVKYGYSFSPDSSLRLHYHRTDNEVEFASPAGYANAFNDRVEDLVTAKWDYSINDNVELFVKGYYHKWDSRWTQINNEIDDNGQLTGDVFFVSDQEFWGYDDYGLTAMARVQSGHGLEYALGYDHQRFSGRDDVLLIADQTETVDAFFGQIRTSEGLIENTRLAFGLRHNSPSGEGNVTVGNFSARHQLNDNLYLRGSAGTSFRLPDAWQLYGNDPCCTLGNPDLEGEESQNLNAALGGSSGLGGRLSWEAILFKREVDNLIGSANGMRINTGNTVDFDGWELTLNLALTSSWSANFDYVSTSAEAQGSNEQIVGVPESTLKLGFTYTADSAPYELSMSLVNVGDLYDTVGGGIGRVEHGGYTVVDLTGAYFFDEDRKHRLGLRLENAFDEKYASSLGRARTDVGSVSYAYRNLGTPQTVHVSYAYRY